MHYQYEHVESAFVKSIMFKFNFIADSENKDYKNEGEEAKTEVKTANKYDECVEVFPTEEQEKIDYFSPDFLITLNAISIQNGHRVYRVPIEDIIDKLIDRFDDINCAEQNHSDLIAGVYEGGAKIWECTESVGEYLTKSDAGKCLIDDFQGCKVFDLGCGAGILGILALLNGASVHFQDYNKTVLQHITIPNVLVNTKSVATLKEKCRFYSGDWLNYSLKTADDEKFDFILTSETIYNVQNYKKIIDIIKTKLKPTGVCYLAAKLHYFGVGGSMRQFEEVLLKENIFESKSVFSCSDNVGREILKITFK